MHLILPNIYKISQTLLVVIIFFDCIITEKDTLNQGITANNNCHLATASDALARLENLAANARRTSQDARLARATAQLICLLELLTN